MNLLEVKQVCKYYANHKAVDDISFSIEPGTIFGLLGPNGAGKTTLIRMITGIFYPDSGSITFNEKPLSVRDTMSQIGYLPEERGLYKKMKVGEHALFLAQLKGLSRKEATKNVTYWFEKMGIMSWWNKKVSDLSKGMGQKLQFIAAVLHNPPVLILDEPFSGLDPVNANVIKDEIFELSKKGTTIIFSTHRMEQVEEICSHIALINLGKKILDGSIKNIKEQFKENVFLIEGKKMPSTEINGVTVLHKADNQLIVKLTDDYTSTDLLKNLLQYNAEITTFKEILPSLNDIFIRQVEHTDAISRKFIP